MSEKPAVIRVTVGERGDGQRLDNFIAGRAANVPKSRIYRAIRRGEVRVNGRRAKPLQRLARTDEVRIPPLHNAAPARSSIKLPRSIEKELHSSVIYEDHEVLVLNKPAGMAVHGGSGLAWGVIEALRDLRPGAPYLELVHRLDRETSGCLMIAKRRSALRRIQEALRERQLRKVYWALVGGHWRGELRTVDAPLRKNTLSSGERMVRVDSAGKSARSRLRPLDRSALASLIEIEIATGRTHQIRVHCAHIGHPIVGDAKYGDADVNDRAKHAIGAKRQHPPDRTQALGLCLHAAWLKIPAPADGQALVVRAAPPDAFIETMSGFGLHSPTLA